MIIFIFVVSAKASITSLIVPCDEDKEDQGTIAKTVGSEMGGFPLLFTFRICIITTGLIGYRRKGLVEAVKLEEIAFRVVFDD